MLNELLWAWGPWAYNKISRGLIRFQKVAQVVYSEFTVKKEWIFFKNSPIAIPVNSEKFWNIDSQSIKWRCEEMPPRFTDPLATPDMKGKHLSYLGFVIKMSERDIDLSDWINDVLYIGLEEPSVGEIFALWCCEKGESYFHRLDSIQVEYITELGDVVRKRA